MTSSHLKIADLRWVDHIFCLIWRPPRPCSLCYIPCFWSRWLLSTNSISIQFKPDRNHLWQIDIFFKFLCKIGKVLKVKRVSKIWMSSTDIHLHQTYIHQVFETPFPKGSGRLQKWKNNEHTTKYKHQIEQLIWEQMCFKCFLESIYRSTVP